MTEESVSTRIAAVRFLQACAIRAFDQAVAGIDRGETQQDTNRRMLRIAEALLDAASPPSESSPVVQ